MQVSSTTGHYKANPAFGASASESLKKIIDPKKIEQYGALFFDYIAKNGNETAYVTAKSAAENSGKPFNLKMAVPNKEQLEETCRKLYVSFLEWKCGMWN